MNGDARRYRPTNGAVLVALSSLVALLWFGLSRRKSEALTVYCAHDLLYAAEVLDLFEAQTGIPVLVEGDTEASKSLGLVQRLIREKDVPVCDVFWNNQMLGTVELARQGVLEPYKGQHWQDIPQQFRDDDGLWTGFGGRMRVWIVNTESPPMMSLSFSGLSPEADLSGIAIAQPMFGTTLSHYAVLWDQMGGAALQQWHRQLVEQGVKFVPGNAAVKDLVAGGVCAMGMTDTDDAFQAIDAGAPVQMNPLRVGTGQTICIPNTVAIIRGTDRRSQAEQLVDFLTSPQIELHMSRSRSRQIPLGSGVDSSQIPEDVQPLVDWARDSVDLRGLADARAECLAWLAEEFAP